MKSLFRCSHWHADMYRCKGIVKRAFGPSDAQRDLVMGLLEMVDSNPGACQRAYVRVSGKALDLCLWQSTESVETISGSPRILWLETEPAKETAIKLFDDPNGDQVEFEEELKGGARALADWITA